MFKIKSILPCVIAQAFALNVYAEASNAEITKPSINAKLAFEQLNAAKQYQISAGSLSHALNQFAQQTGLDLVFDPRLTEGKQTKGLAGKQTIQEGFENLLLGTALEAQPDGKGGYQIQRRGIIQAPKKTELELKSVEIRAKRLYEIGPLPGLALTKEEIPGNVQSITAKEIKESHALSISDLMNSKLQSVNVNDYQSNPFQMDVTYRGFTASPQIGTAQGLSVFLDGIRVNEPFGDVVNWDMIPLNALAGIDVFPGSNPIFGLGTLGGTISMKTKSGFDGNEGTVEALGGSFNRKQFQGSISGNNGVIAGFAAANIFMEDGWRDNSPSKVNQLFGKAEWRNETLQLGLSGLYAGNKLTGNGLLPTELAEQDRSSVFTSPDVTKNKLLQFQLTGLWDVSDTFNITGQVYRRKSKRNASTGDVNENFGGIATRRPNPGEKASPGFADLNNDGLPDLSDYAENVAAIQTAIGPVILDANGNPEQIDDGSGTDTFIPNPAFDANNLAVGTNFNNVVSGPAGALQSMVLAADGVTMIPLWTANYNAPPAVNTPLPVAYYNAAIGTWNNIALGTPLEGNSTHPNGLSENTFNPIDFGIDYINANFTDDQGFYHYAQALVINPNDIYFSDGNGNPILDGNGNPIPKLVSATNLGLSFPGRPALLYVPGPDGVRILRDGSNVGFSRPQASGYIDGTPTAIVTETKIDQVTDGASMQLNWNLDKHKFMVGMSLDSASSTYDAQQRLGILDQNRNAVLDPSLIGAEFYAATNPVLLNQFSGTSITKSIYASETWTPVDTLNITGAVRYNATKVKSVIAGNRSLARQGPGYYLNFLSPKVLCTDVNADGVVTADECPETQLLDYPFSKPLQLAAKEKEQFSYYSLNPSIGATWQANSNLNIYGNWSQGARTPSVIELGCALDDTPVVVLTNPDGSVVTRPRSVSERRVCSLPSTLSGDPYLPQVISQTTEFGLRGKLSESIEWNASVYQTNLKDDIYFVSVSPERSFFQSIGDTRRQGFEVGVKGKLDKLSISLNYALTDATFQNKFLLASPNNSSAGRVIQVDGIRREATGYQQIGVKPGDRMPGIPLHNLNANFSYEVTPDWTVGLSAVLHSSAFVRGNENNKHKSGSAKPLQAGCTTVTTDENGIQTGVTCSDTYARPDFRYGGKTAGYAVFNFNSAYKITKGLTAGLQITNLFDRDYQSAGRLGINPFSPSINGVVGANGFNYNSSDWRSSTFLAPGAPRAAYITLTYDFDFGK